LVKYREFGRSKTIESDAMHCVRSVRGHKDGNMILVGGENSKVS